MIIYQIGSKHYLVNQLNRKNRTFFQQINIFHGSKARLSFHQINQPFCIYFHLQIVTPCDEFMLVFECANDMKKWINNFSFHYSLLFTLYCLIKIVFTKVQLEWWNRNKRLKKFNKKRKWIKNKKNDEILDKPFIISIFLMSLLFTVDNIIII